MFKDFLDKHIEEQIQIILDALDIDTTYKYIEYKSRTLKNIAEATLEIIQKYCYYSSENPIGLVQDNNVMICFEPEPDKPKTLQWAIVYFAHFATQTHGLSDGIDFGNRGELLTKSDTNIKQNNDINEENNNKMSNGGIINKQITLVEPYFSDINHDQEKSKPKIIIHNNTNSSYDKQAQKNILLYLKNLNDSGRKVFLNSVLKLGQTYNDYDVTFYLNHIYHEPHTDNFKSNQLKYRATIGEAYKDALNQDDESPNYIRIWKKDGTTNYISAPQADIFGGYVGDMYDAKGDLKQEVKDLAINVLTQNLTQTENKFLDGGKIKDMSIDQNKIISSSSRFKPYETIYFEKPIIGINGAKLLSYTWAYEWQEDFNENVGETISKRVSDWTQAEQSAETGKNIVHQFTIELPDGKKKTVSSESVLILLGYSEKEQLKSFPSLVNSLKTLAKQRMKLSIMEIQEKEFFELRNKLQEGEKPEIKEVDEQIDSPHLKQDWKEGKWKVFSMGNTWRRQDNIFDYDTKKYVERTITKDTVEQLTYQWINDQIKQAGVTHPNEIYDLRNRIKRQEKKVEQLADGQIKMDNGGEIQKKYELSKKNVNFANDLTKSQQMEPTSKTVSETVQEYISKWKPYMPRYINEYDDGYQTVTDLDRALMYAKKEGSATVIDVKTMKTATIYKGEIEKNDIGKLQDGGEIDSDLTGRTVLLHFMGVPLAEKNIIQDVYITPEHFQHRNVTITLLDENTITFPLSKFNDFLTGKEILLKGEKEDYTIELIQNKLENGGQMETQSMDVCPIKVGTIIKNKSAAENDANWAIAEIKADSMILNHKPVFGTAKPDETITFLKLQELFENNKVEIEGISNDEKRLFHLALHALELNHTKKAIEATLAKSNELLAANNVLILELNETLSNATITISEREEIETKRLELEAENARINKFNSEVSSFKNATLSELNDAISASQLVLESAPEEERENLQSYVSALNVIKEMKEGGSIDKPKYLEFDILTDTPRYHVINSPSYHGKRHFYIVTKVLGKSNYTNIYNVPISEYEYYVNSYVGKLGEGGQSTGSFSISEDKVQLYHANKEELEWLIKRYEDYRSISSKNLEADEDSAIIKSLKEKLAALPEENITWLAINSEHPLSTQLRKITGDAYNTTDFESLDGSELSTAKPFRHVATGKMFAVKSKNIWSVEVQRTPDGQWEELNEKPLSKEGAEKFKKDFENSGTKYHALKIDVPLFAKGGDINSGIQKMKEIKIHWAEGKTSYVSRFPKTYTSWETANDDLRPLVAKKDEGYNKAKFTVTFEDGETYNGRLDLSQNEDNAELTNNVVGNHINDYLKYELSDKSASAESTKKEIKEWLQKYDLGLNKDKGAINDKVWEVSMIMNPIVPSEIKNPRIIKRTVTLGKDSTKIDAQKAIESEGGNIKEILSITEKAISEIPNNYEGKTAEQVWSSWNEKQRENFLLDHSELLDKDRHGNNLGHSRIVQKDKSYNELTPHTKRVLESHVNSGQYKRGGIIEAKNITLEQAYDKFDGYYFISAHYGLRNANNSNKAVIKWLKQKEKELGKNLINATWTINNEITIYCVDGIFLIKDASEQDYDKFYQSFPDADIEDNMDDDEYKNGGSVKVGEYELIRELWSSINGGNGIDGTIRTVPQNYYVATIDKKGNIRFEDMEAMTKNVDKEQVKKLFESGKIPTKDKMKKGGTVKKIVITKISDIPNLQEKVDTGKVTYRGLGLGKLADDFYKASGGDSGRRIKVDGKEYFITEEEYKKLNWDFENNKWLGKIKFDAPFRKFEKGGSVEESYNGRYVSLQETPTGLLIKLNEDGKEELQSHEVEGEEIYMEPFFIDVFEDIQVNSDWEFILNSGEAGLGLSDAPSIIKGYVYDDDGQLEETKDSKLFYYNDYAITDFARKLKDEGEVFFTKATMGDGGSVKSFKDGGDVSVATEIRNQIGGKSLYMLGAYDIYADGNALVFKIKGSPTWKSIRVALNSMDTYDMTFSNWRKRDLSDLKEKKIDGVYSDQLNKIIEKETGLYTKLEKGGDISNSVDINNASDKAYDFIVQTIKVQKRLLSAKDLWGDGTRFKPLNFKQFEVTYSHIKKITEENPDFKFEKGGALDMPSTEKLKKLGISTTTEFGSKFRKFLNKANKDNNNGEYVGYQLDLQANRITVIGKKGTIEFEITNYDNFNVTGMRARMVHYKQGGIIKNANKNEKSKSASKVLQLMDEDYSYQDALKKVLAEDKTVKKTRLEKELNKYI